MNAIEKYETACKALDSGLMTLGDFEKEIAPLRDVAPVVHGKWIENSIPDSMLKMCSNCGFTCGAYSFNFCPNCGAKMDGKGEE